MTEMGHIVRGTYCVLVVGKSMGKQRLFSCQTVDQMVAMPPNSVINPLASAGALTRMVVNLWGLEQMEDVFAEVKVCIYNKCIHQCPQRLACRDNTFFFKLVMK